MFGRNMHSIKSRRVQEAIWRLHEEIDDRTKLFKSKPYESSQSTDFHMILDDFERFWKKHYFVIFSHQNIEIITTIDCDKKELPRSMEQNKSVRWRM